jgi:hypothetical protein
MQCRPKNQFSQLTICLSHYLQLHLIWLHNFSSSPSIKRLLPISIADLDCKFSSASGGANRTEPLSLFERFKAN